MRRNILLALIMLSLFLAAAMLGGCGSSNKEAGAGTPSTQLANAVKLGDLNCLQCHNDGKDLTMNNDLDTRTIGGVWQDSLHNGDLNGIQTVHCEDCHGGGEFHWGTGPLAHPVPDSTVCNSCHSGATAAALGLNDKTGFAATAHANGNNRPDSTFSQIATPVSSGQHIEECSVCHDNNQRFVYDNSGNLLKPDPANLPAPQVACASCHDGHQVARTDDILGSGQDYQIFRKVRVNTGTDPNGNTVGLANNANTGTWLRPQMLPTKPGDTTEKTAPPFVTNAIGLNLYVAVTPTNNPWDSTTERTCASCHSKGTYKFSNLTTHNNNTYGQYLNSAHGNKADVPWHEFTNFSSSIGVGTAGHRSNASYPFDMSLAANTAPSTCFKCHNGLASPTFMGPFDTNARRPTAGGVVWGNATATCVTCHDPHTGTKNIRVPQVMTNYSGAGGAFLSANTLLDKTTQFPTDITSVVCILCHQGRESGFTLWLNNFSPNRINVGTSFKFNNPHYLGGAAMLYGANGYEFTQNALGLPTTTASNGYASNQVHIANENCAGCHMGNPTADSQTGGHSWNPNIVTCQACHSSITDFDTFRSPFDTNNYDGTGSTTPIPVVILNLSKMLSAQLQANGIFYFAPGIAGQYFFTSAAHTTAFTYTKATTNIQNLLRASFNIQFVVKALPNGGPDPIGAVNDVGTTVTSGTPNTPAATHNYRYAIELLQDSIVAAGGTLPLNTIRPQGTRPAVIYLDKQGNGGNQ